MGWEWGRRLQTRVQEYLGLLEVLKTGEGVGAVGEGRMHVLGGGETFKHCRDER